MGLCNASLWKVYLNPVWLRLNTYIIQSSSWEVIALTRQFAIQERWTNNDADSFLVLRQAARIKRNFLKVQQDTIQHET